MSETTALAISKEYPADKFNLLIPVKTMQELSPLHKLVINEVQIDTAKEAKDTYIQNGELALTKKALMKLMAAANIQIIDSHSVPTQNCNRCIEIAQRTRQAPKCFECPYRDDVAYQVTIAVPEPSGTYRRVTATKEIRMEDAEASMSQAQFKAFKPFRTEQCESKALNRALREGLMIKSTYKEAELKKPFAVALVMPNMSDPDLKAAMIKNYANNSNALYGGALPSAEINLGPEPEALPEGNVTIIGVDEPDDFDMETGEVTPPSQEVIDISTDDFVMDEEANCSDCGKELQPFKDKKGTEWTVQDTIDYSMGNCNRILCIACAVKEIKAKQKEGGK